MFVLASASPARLRLLQLAGIEPVVRKSHFDESQIQSSKTSELVQILARCKAQVVAKEFTNALILGCDSVLEVNGEVHGKPESRRLLFVDGKKCEGIQAFFIPVTFSLINTKVDK